MPTNDSRDYARDIEPVSLLIGGRLHNGWSRYDVDSDLLKPAAAWRVQLGMPQDELPDVVMPGARVEVQVGSDTVMSGYVDDVDDSVDGRTSTLALTGRDAACILVDCSAPIFSATDMSLEQVVKSVVMPLGLSRVKIDPRGRVISEKVNIEPGDTAWDALLRAAEANGLWPWFAPDGTLIVGGPDYEAPPVASLIMKLDGKENNVSAVSRVMSMAKRYSEITVLGQAHGTDDAQGKHGMRTIVNDPAVTLYRPKIIVASDAPNNEALSRQANKELADSRLDGLTFRVEIRGHRTSGGVLWAPGQRVHLISERHGVDDVYFVMGRKFQGGSGTPSKTFLTLKEDKVWIPVLIPPKRSKGASHGNTQAFSPQELGTLS